MSKDDEETFPSSLALRILKSDSDDTTDDDSNSALPADVNRQDGNGLTLLMKACIQGKENVIVTLLEAQADINQTDHYGKTALIHAAKVGGAKALQLLIKNGADIECFDSTGNSALIYAIKDNRKSVIDVLLQAGVDVNASNYGTPTPLIEAVERGAVDLALELLEAGALVNLSDKEGITALHVAARNKHPEMLNALIQHSANVNTRTRTRGITPLASCIMLGLDLREDDAERTKKCVDVLVDAGADTDLSKIKSSTLSFSVLLGRESLVEHLFKRGLSIDIPLDEADFVLLKVVTRGSAAAMRYLLRQGATITTELHQAVILGRAEMVQLLIQNGALPTPKPISALKVNSNVKLLSPLALAFLFNRAAIARYFMYNKFMLNYDLHTLPINSDIIQKLFLPPTKETFPTVELFKQAFSQPWRLCNMAFLALSTSIGVEVDRAKKVSVTGLPDFLQQKLMFKHSNVDIPVDQWDNIQINM
ncbi:ankyrin repeat protein [Biomphalaria pfeifferi]|uniref:Ankyrin repeat protein n=1 Tax=Biomphalaria pfeifferi TaxID=112525 RepID=A0AAD8F582_BIOPF|nr:ankyrin repeat protein [Biomphalaria pfeifferi]